MGNLIVGFVADLMFQTRIEGSAKNLGMGVLWLESEDQVISMDVDEPAALGSEGILVEKITHLEPNLLLFDLGNGEIPWSAWISALKTTLATQRIPVICFGSHVDIDMLKEARQAGADEVLARSRFVTALPDLIRRYALDT